MSISGGYYDPFSIFQGGFRADFDLYTQIPQSSFKIPNSSTIFQLKNVDLSYNEELPSELASSVPFLKFMFIPAGNLDDYRSTTRPLLRQWIQSVHDISPKIPLFLILFENTELKSTADKLLKVSIESKTKKDFPAVSYPNLSIFRVKSIYATTDEKVTAWSLIKEKIKQSINESIWNKLEFYSNNEKEKAFIYLKLGMFKHALAAYQQLYDKIFFISSKDGNIDIDMYLKSNLFYSSHVTIKEPANKLEEKIFYFQTLSSILLETSTTASTKQSNAIQLGKILLDLINAIEPSTERYELSVLLISEFLKLPLISSQSSIDEDKSNWKAPNPEFFALLGEIKYLKRNEFLKLGNRKGFEVKGLLIDVTTVDTSFNSNYEEVRSALIDYDTFLNKIVEESLEIIKFYQISGTFEHMVAVLEAEFALLLHYNNTKYSSDLTFKYLVNSYDYFHKNCWSKISLPLLEVYIEYLEQQIPEINKNDKKSLTDRVTTSKNLLKSYLELISLEPSFYDEDKLERYTTYYCSCKLDKFLLPSLMLEIPNMFDIHSISPLYCSATDTYALDISILSKISLPKIRNCVLELTADNKEQTVIYFETNESIKWETHNKLQLTSTTFMEAKYTVTKLYITLEGSEASINISHRYYENLHTVNIFEIPLFKTDKIYQNTTATVQVPKIRSLHMDALEFTTRLGDLGNSDTIISDCVFTFYKVEADRIVSDAIYEIFNGNKNPIDFEFHDELDRLLFKTLSTFNPGDVISISIPFFFPAEVTNTNLSLQYSFSYTINKVEYIQFHTKNLSTHLAIAASVDEKIQSTNLFSHYTVNSVSPLLPVCIQNVSLEAGKSKVQEWKNPKDVMVFMDQGSTFFFKISELKDKEVILKIEYNSLWDEIVDLISHKFYEKLLKENEHLLKYLQVIKKIWESIDYKVNHYALSNIIIAHNFKMETHFSKISCISTVDRELLIQLIKDHMSTISQWSKNFSSEHIRQVRENLKQELWVSVPLPTIDVIYTVQYIFPDALQYTIAEPIPVKVLLNVTRVYQYNHSGLSEEKSKHVRFDEPDIVTSNILGTIPTTLEFAESVNWLVAGLKNLSISVDKITEYEFELKFIPLKTGKLELPLIDVKTTNTQLSTHVDFKNRAQVISVVDKLNTILQYH